MCGVNDASITSASEPGLRRVGALAGEHSRPRCSAEVTADGVAAAGVAMAGPMASAQAQVRELFADHPRAQWEIQDQTAVFRPAGLTTTNLERIGAMADHQGWSRALQPQGARANQGRESCGPPTATPRGDSACRPLQLALRR